MNNRKTQCQRLLEHMKSRPITNIEAFTRYGITSLHRRLSDLKQRGVKVKMKWLKLHDGTRYKEYWV